MPGRVEPEQIARSVADSYQDFLKRLFPEIRGWDKLREFERQSVIKFALLCAPVILLLISDFLIEKDFPDQIQVLMFLYIFFLINYGMVLFIAYDKERSRQWQYALEDYISSLQKTERQQTEASARLYPALDQATGGVLNMMATLNDASRHSSLYDTDQIPTLLIQVKDLCHQASEHLFSVISETLEGLNPNSLFQLTQSLGDQSELIWTTLASFYRHPTDKPRKDLAQLVATSLRQLDPHQLRQVHVSTLQSAGHQPAFASSIDHGPAVKTLEEYDPLTIHSLCKILSHVVMDSVPTNQPVVVVSEVQDMLTASLLRHALVQSISPMLVTHSSFSQLISHGADGLANKDVRFSKEDRLQLKNSEPQTVILVCNSPESEQHIRSVIFDLILQTNCPEILVVAINQGWVVANAFPSAELRDAVMANNNPSLIGQVGDKTSWQGAAVYRIDRELAILSPLFTDHSLNKIPKNYDTSQQLLARQKLVEEGQLVAENDRYIFRVEHGDGHALRAMYLVHMGVIRASDCAVELMSWFSPLVDALQQQDPALQIPPPWQQPELWEREALLKSFNLRTE